MRRRFTEESFNQHGTGHAGKRAGRRCFVCAAYICAETIKNSAFPNLLGKIGGLDVNVTRDVGLLPIFWRSLVQVAEHTSA